MIASTTGTAVALVLDVKPAALIVFSEHWTGAMLRAELLERGWGAACARSMAEAVLLAPGSGVSVALVDQAALTARDPRLVAWAAGYDRIRLVLLTGSLTETQGGPWHRVLHRPLALGAIADALASVASEPRVAASAPEDDPLANGGFSIRLDPPWPSIVCARCGKSRHYEVPRDDREEDDVEADLPAFVVEHANCGG